VSQPKSAEELSGLRISCGIAARALAAVCEKVAPGVTTAELDLVAFDSIKQEGAEPAFKGYRGFPASICTSIDYEVVHGIPGDRRLVEGQIISIDLGTLKDGFYGDTAVTVPVGEISQEARRLIEATEASLKMAIEQAGPDSHLHDIGRTIQEYVEKQGFSVVRDFVGHGIGKALWEEPQVPNFYPGSDGPKLTQGMTLAIEPMVNFGGYDVKVLDDGWTVVTTDSSLSAHFEHTIAIGEHGGEILTRA
jgi:methionyl aminopeptidase